MYIYVCTYVYMFVCICTLMCRSQRTTVDAISLATSTFKKIFLRQELSLACGSLRMLKFPRIHLSLQCTIMTQMHTHRVPPPHITNTSHTRAHMYTHAHIHVHVYTHTKPHKNTYTYIYTHTTLPHIYTTHIHIHIPWTQVCLLARHLTESSPQP